MAWRVIFLCCLILLLSGTWAKAQVRKWTARTGDFTVEAELIDVANDIASLKRADGKIVKVALDKLSLGDLRYIKQALADAASATGGDKEKAKPAAVMPEEDDPFKPVTPRGGAPTPKGSPEDPKSMEPNKTEAKKPEPISGPPLAKPDLTTWQGAPDPAAKEMLLRDIKEISTRCPGIGTNKPFTPATPSRFLAYRESSNTAVHVFDFAASTRVTFNIPASSIDKVALSPDGDEIAVGFSGDTHISIFSVRKKALKTKIDTKQNVSLSPLLVYSAANRLLYLNTSTKNVHIVNTESGEEIATFQAQALYDAKRIAISPGGAYMALMPKYDATLQLFDLRNGLLAGEFEPPQGDIQSHITMGFSPDGKEFAVVGGSLKTSLHCWDMATGRILVSHQLNKSLSQINSLYTLHSGPTIEWFQNGLGWLLYGVAVVDRKGGGPTYVKQQQVAADLPIRWLMDDERQLVFTSDSSSGRLGIEKFPLADVSKSAMIVASGGSTSDLHLPPLSKFDISSARHPEFSATKFFAGSLPKIEEASIKPAKFASIAAPRGYITELHISPSGKAGVYINGGPPAKNGDQTVSYLNYVDLASGNVEKTLTLAYPADFSELSQDGKLAVFHTGPDKDRIDLMKMPDGESFGALRPYPNSQPFLPALDRARFVGENRLLSIAADGHAHLWSMPEFKGLLEFSYTSEFSSWPSPTGSHILVQYGSDVSLVDVQKGSLVGALETPPIYSEEFLIEGVSFSNDGTAIAAVLDTPKRTSPALVIWDLASGKLRKTLSITAADGVLWMNPTMVLVRQRKVINPNEINLSETWKSRFQLIDIASGRVLWKYTLPDGKASMQNYGGRFWYVARSGFSSPYALVGTPIPSPESTSLISGAPAPKVLLSSGAKVSLATNVLVARDSLADKALEEKFRAKVTDLLAKRGVKVVDDAPLRVIANLEEKETGRMIRFLITGAPGLSGARLELRETLLTCEMKLEDGSGEVWKNSKSFEIKPEQVEKGVPDKKKPREYFRDLQAQGLMTWLGDAAIPTNVYEGWYYNGVGESELGMAGETIRIRNTVKR